MLYKALSHSAHQWAAMRLYYCGSYVLVQGWNVNEASKPAAARVRRARNDLQARGQMSAHYYCYYYKLGDSWSGRSAVRLADSW